MASGAENFLRFLGATDTADRMNPAVAEKNRMLEERQMQRDALLNSGVLGNLSQQIPNFDAQRYIAQGGDVGTLGTLATLSQPKLTKFQENLQTLQQVGQMPDDMKELYAGLFGKGGVNVNIGGDKTSPFQEKFQENMGKQAANQIAELDTQASDFGSMMRGSEQALKILQENPNLSISPLAPVTNEVKSLFSDFLDEDALQGVSDFQSLTSKLTDLRFDVTKKLKGAITESEQEAAQTVAGSVTGTREGLEQTLTNNVAYSALQQDYAQRKRDYIQEQGEKYSPAKFDKYYKELGESGQRPTLDSLLGIKPAAKAPKAGSTIDWSAF